MTGARSIGCRCSATSRSSAICSARAAARAPRTNLMVFIRPTILRTAEDAQEMTARRYNYVRGHQLIVNPNREPTHRRAGPRLSRAPRPARRRRAGAAAAATRCVHAGRRCRRARRRRDERSPAGAEASAGRGAVAPSPHPLGFARRARPAPDRGAGRPARRGDARGRGPEGADRVAPLPRPALRGAPGRRAGVRPPALRSLSVGRPRPRPTRPARSASATTRLSPAACRAPRICSTRPTTRPPSA